MTIDRSFQRSGVHVYRRADGSHFLILRFRTDPSDGSRVEYGAPEELVPERMQAEGLGRVMAGIEDELKPLAFDPAEVARMSDAEAEAFESAYAAVSVRRDEPGRLTITPLRLVTSSGRASDPGTESFFDLPGRPSDFYHDILKSLLAAS